MTDSTSPDRDEEAERFRFEFDLALTIQLKSRAMKRNQLAAATGVSNAYVSKMARVGPSPRWVDVIADATNATDEERMTLHRAAARSKGFRID